MGSRLGVTTDKENSGDQNTYVNEIMTRVFFMSDTRWNECRKRGKFDYVIVGSSFCAWAFTDRMLKKNSSAKILILERGEYYYPEHIQNLLPSTVKDFAKHSKTFPWKTSERMRNGQYIKKVNGMNNIFGGKSPFWRGWCPQPTREELHGWPESVKDTIEEYFPEAKELLNVINANEIDASEEKCCVFGELQNVLEERIKSCKPAAIQRVDPASLALKSDTPRYVKTFFPFILPIFFLNFQPRIGIASRMDSKRIPSTLYVFKFYTTEFSTPKQIFTQCNNNVS